MLGHGHLTPIEDREQRTALKAGGDTCASTDPPTPSVEALCVRPIGDIGRIVNAI